MTIVALNMTPLILRTAECLVLYFPPGRSINHLGCFNQMLCCFGKLLKFSFDIHEIKYFHQSIQVPGEVYQKLCMMFFTKIRQSFRELVNRYDHQGLFQKPAGGKNGLIYG